MRPRTHLAALLGASLGSLSGFTSGFTARVKTHGMAALARMSRNSPERINAKRGYDPTAIASSPPPTRTPWTGEVPNTAKPRKLSRIERQQASERAKRTAKFKAAAAGRVSKPRALAPLSGMQCAGNRPLKFKRSAYPFK